MNMLLRPRAMEHLCRSQAEPSHCDAAANDAALSNNRLKALTLTYESIALGPCLTYENSIIGLGLAVSISASGLKFSKTFSELHLSNEHGLSRA